MKFSLLQFAISKNPQDNYAKIKQAVQQAKDNGAQVLVTQECALSGYPPIEIASVNEIDFTQQDAALGEIVDLAQQSGLYVLLGLIRQVGGELRNSMAIIKPTGEVEYYDKRALWGWDAENFLPGESNGIIDIDGVKIGIRICFEVRFPEYFRELYAEKVDIAIVSFCDLQNQADPKRLSIIRSHLLTRAIENAFTVLSVNSTTLHQTAPTAVIDPDGNTLLEAELNRESMVYYEHQPFKPEFGTKGRIYYSDKLVG